MSTLGLHHGLVDQPAERGEHLAIGAVLRRPAELRRGVRRGLACAAEQMAGVRLRQQARHVAASGSHGSLGSGLAGHSSSRAPRTAAWSEKRSSGLATL